MEMWEQIALGVLALVILFWWGPGAKRSLQHSRRAEKGEWMGVIIPIAVVVLFVLFLIQMV